MVGRPPFFRSLLDCALIPGRPARGTTGSMSFFICPTPERIAWLIGIEVGLDELRGACHLP